MTKKAKARKVREPPPEAGEYVGGMKFGPAEGKPVKPQTSLEEWLVNAQAEWVLTRFAAWILNATDAEMEDWTRRADDPEKFLNWLLDLCEQGHRQADRYEAGAKTLRSVGARIIVICERAVGPEKMGRAA